MLPTFDLHVSHCGFWAMSKTVTEASLAGLPTVINLHPEGSISEYDGDWILQCENTPEAYRETITSVLNDQLLWRTLAQKAYAHAQANFGSKRMEDKTVSLYQSVMAMTDNS